MRYTQIKFVPMSALSITVNPELGEAASSRPDGYASFICQVDTEKGVNEYLENGWDIVRFITHHSAKTDRTAVMAVLGKPYGYNDASIDTLELTVRASNVLKAEGVWTIGALISRTEMDLLKMPYMGRRTLNMIKETLGEHNLSLRGPS